MINPIRIRHSNTTLLSEPALPRALRSLHLRIHACLQLIQFLSQSYIVFRPWRTENTNPMNLPRFFVVQRAF
jgi:hypothetical protein